MGPNMNGTSSDDSSHDYYYDYYNFYPSTESFYSDDSSMSTPSKQGAAGVYKRNRNNMDAALKADLFGLILDGVDVEEYVQHVYGVSKKDVEAIRGKEWNIEGLPAYRKLLDEGAREEELCEPFKMIMANLFNTFIKEGRKLVVYHASLGKTALKSVWNIRKPDQLFFFGSHDDKSPTTWSLAKAFVELAVTSSAQRVAAFGLSISTIGEGSVATGVLAASAPDLMPSPTITTPSGTKRRSTDTPDGPRPASQRPKLALAQKEPQAAGYALELLASTCRRWATGLVITDTQVALHYYDRVGAIFTKPFKFDEEPWKLALFALAIGECNLVQAGFEPLVAANVDTPLSTPLSSLKHAVLHVPKDDEKEEKAEQFGDNKVQGEGNDGIEFVDKLGQGAYSHFEITDNPLYIYGGLTGRGSHVLPGDLVKRKDATSQDGTGGMGDRGKRPAIPATSEGGMVAKLSWPMEGRPCLEAQTINGLLKKIPWMKHQLPRIHCAITLKGESMGLPRHLFHDMTIAHKLERRYFTLLFTDRYQHLWDIKTLPEFQMAYIDIVECHYAATRYGKILHRDISENNLLWTRGSRRVFGVLNDWDLATPVDAIGNSTNHRTGTGPFMALDLLGKVPPVHLYRHDLESLFYVLIWAAVHYNIGGTVPYSRIVHTELEKWNGSYLEARDAKCAFLGRPKAVLECILPAWEPLRAIWLKPLSSLFQKAYHNANLYDSAETAQSKDVAPGVLTGAQLSRLDEDSDDESDDENDDEAHCPRPTAPVTPVAPEDIDFETLGGCLTYENFLAALDGATPRTIRPKYLPVGKEQKTQ